MTTQEALASAKSVSSMPFTDEEMLMNHKPQGVRDDELASIARALLPRAIEIAEKQHAGQVDNAGQPYIEHPKRVMCHMRTDAERIVAVLHDVIEDGTMTLAACMPRASLSRSWRRSTR